MPAGQPLVVDGGTAVAVIVDALDRPQEAVGVAFTVGDDPEPSEGIEFVRIGGAQTVDEPFDAAAVGLHACDETGAAPAG